MIFNLRIDYTGSHESVNLDKLADFVTGIHEMLLEVTDEINEQHAVLVIKVYDGKRMTYVFENISAETSRKINQLSRPS